MRVSFGSRCAILLISSGVILAAAHDSFSAIGAADWGQISRACFQNADAIFAGTVVRSKALADVDPWWAHYIGGPDLLPHEAEFQIDHVIRGPQELVGKIVHVRYIGSNATGRNVRPDFVSIVGNRRSLVCVVKQVPTDEYFIFPTDNGAFTIAGARPTNVSGKWTEIERLSAEMASALHSEDRAVAKLTMRYLPNLGLNHKHIRWALRDRCADTDSDVAAHATSALIRLGEISELFWLQEFLDYWKGNSALIIGGALW